MGEAAKTYTDNAMVRDHILTTLRYWVVEMHVDRFRFDLAAVLGRSRSGNLLPNAPLLQRIAEDPILRDVRIIAEAWDAAGAYAVGSFSERRWAAWNGQYRDDVRRFWRGADAVDFGLPPVLPGARWHLAVDTSREAPQDPFAAGEEPLWEDLRTYHLSLRSSAILLAR